MWGGQVVITSTLKTSRFRSDYTPFDRLPSHFVTCRILQLLCVCIQFQIAMFVVLEIINCW